MGQGDEYFLNNQMKFSDFVGFRDDTNVELCRLVLASRAIESRPIGLYDSHYYSITL